MVKRWVTTTSGPMNIIAIRIATFASCLLKSKRNTGPGGIAMATGTSRLLKNYS